MPVNRPKHIKGPGTVFATATVRDWKPLFSDHTVARIVVGVLDEVTSRFDVTVFGYVIMPTHVHLLLHLPELRTLSRIMQTFKSLSTRKVAGVLSRDLGTLWKRRFDDLIIVSEEQFITKLRYIHNNPVKAGLVAVAADWEFSSAGDWLMNRPGLIQVQKEMGRSLK